MVLALIDAHTTDKRPEAAKKQGQIWDGCFEVEHRHLLKLKEQLKQVFGAKEGEND